MNESDLLTAMEELLLAEPELTFREVMTELLKKKLLEYASLEDDYVHSWLYDRYAKVRTQVMAGRVNRGM